MTYIQIFLFSLVLIQVMMALLWIVSIRLKNVSIVDPFWGLGFVVAALLYFMKGEGFEVRKDTGHDHDSPLGSETFDLPLVAQCGEGGGLSLQAVPPGLWGETILVDQLLPGLFSARCFNVAYFSSLAGCPVLWQRS